MCSSSQASLYANPRFLTQFLTPISFLVLFHFNISQLDRFALHKLNLSLCHQSRRRSLSVLHLSQVPRPSSQLASGSRDMGGRDSCPARYCFETRLDVSLNNTLFHSQNTFDFSSKPLTRFFIGTTRCRSSLPERPRDRTHHAHCLSAAVPAVPAVPAAADDGCWWCPGQPACHDGCARGLRRWWCPSRTACTAAGRTGANGANDGRRQTASLHDAR